MDEQERSIPPAKVLDSIWWCALARQAIPQNTENRTDCGPDLQCTGGRRRALPCGPYYLLPVEEDECMAPGCTNDAEVALVMWGRPVGRVCQQHGRLAPV